ncbi:serine hydrolase [Micromonospora sp. BRA006-A]|nr:serine hydrolase [Micromonospora sp. BRA006-A]
MSDNTAADLLLRRVGADVLPMLAAELDLPRTRIVGGPRQLVETMLSDVGARTEADFARIFPPCRPNGSARCGSSTPSTPAPAPPGS